MKNTSPSRNGDARSSVRRPVTFRRVVAAGLAALSVSACHRRAPVAVAVTAASTDAQPDVTMIRRVDGYLDAERARAGIGSIRAVVRVYSQPTINVQNFQVELVRGTARQRRVQRDDRGPAVLLDSLGGGTYELIGRQIGMASKRVVVDVIPGCQTEVEFYLDHQAIGIEAVDKDGRVVSSIPNAPTRATITYCGVR